MNPRDPFSTDAIERELKNAELAKPEVPLGTHDIRDFFAHLPTGKFLYAPTGELWPAHSVDSQFPKTNGSKASDALRNCKPISQIVWHPDYPQVVQDEVLKDGGWVPAAGARCFNEYRAPLPKSSKGDASMATMWVDHLRRMYPEDYNHVIDYLAHKVQFPGVKINHAIVMGGPQGIGKDTVLEAVRRALGPWNVSDVGPAKILARFNGWIRCVLAVISEARDLGEGDRFTFYEHTKTYTAAPPDVLPCDRKFLNESPVANVMGVVVTTNHKTGGIYLPADDRRHFVAWSELTKDDFAEKYWTDLWSWYERDLGFDHVRRPSHTRDLSRFNPKAPPPKTDAWWAIVHADTATEEEELSELFERLGYPAALTLEDMADAAEVYKMHDLHELLTQRTSRRSIPHRVERAGYTSVKNEGRADGRWTFNGRHLTVYASSKLSRRDQQRAAKILPQKFPVTEFDSWKS